MNKVSILLNISNRIISSSGLMILSLVAINVFTDELLGYYYLFYSLLFLRFFAELGLGVAVTQFITYSRSDSKNDFQPKEYVWFFRKWYGWAALVAFFLIFPSIYIFDPAQNWSTPHINTVILPWLIVSICTSLSVYQTGMLAIVEGYEKIRDVSKIRLISSFIYSTTTGLLMILDFGLWSLSAGLLLSILFIYLKLNKFKKGIFSDLTKPKNNHKKNIALTVLPFQWRLAASWISGYFIFYLMTPTVIKHHGVAEGGSFGFTMQVFQYVASLSAMVVSTNMAVFGNMISNNRIYEFKKIFFKYSIISLCFTVLILMTFWAVYYLDLNYETLNISKKLLSAKSLYLMSIGSLGLTFFYIVNYYSRAFRKELTWGISLAQSFVLTGWSLYAVPQFDLYTIILGYVVSIWIFWFMIALPYVLIRFRS